MIFRNRGIEYSWVYQDILAKGRAEGEAIVREEARAQWWRETLLRLGRKKLGEPREQDLSSNAAVRDPDLLRRVLEDIFDVSTWDDFLAPLDQ